MSRTRKIVIGFAAAVALLALVSIALIVLGGGGSGITTVTNGITP